MLTEDYIIRMINLAIAALLRIVGLKKSGDYQEAQQLIELTLEQLLGLKANMARSLEDDKLYYLLTRNDQLDTRRLSLVAQLFEHEGDILAAQGRTAESQEDYLRALKYFVEISFHEPLPMDEGELALKIEELVHRLDFSTLNVVVSASTLWPLFLYYEKSGEFARAERVLLGLLDQPELRAELQPELIAFYERLLALPPEALKKGGLTPQVVRDKLDDWKQS